MVIGLTGGVGSGKSTVAKLLADKWKAKLLIADEMGHLAYKRDTMAYQKIVDLFGEGILTDGREINREAIAECIFKDASLRQKLNGIIHPFVMEMIRQEIASFNSQKHEGKPPLILESAILIESGCAPLCDVIWYVHVPEKIRRQRLKESRGYSDEKIDDIMASQMAEEEFFRYATDVIENHGGLEEVFRQCTGLREKYMI